MKAFLLHRDVRRPAVSTLAAAGLLWSSTAFSGFYVELQSTPEQVLPTQGVSLDVIFSGLDERVPDIVTAYTLALTYPEQMLQPTGLSFQSSALMSPFFTDTDDSLNNPGGFIDQAFGQGVASNRIAFSELASTPTPPLRFCSRASTASSRSPSTSSPSPRVRRISTSSTTSRKDSTSKARATCPTI